MTSKNIISSYAILMGIAGIAMLFGGEEVTSLLAVPGSPVINSIIAALYFGFAMVNWHARTLIVGGVFGRPLLLGNLTHASIGAISLIKLAYLSSTTLIIILAVIYSIYAFLFFWLMRTQPKVNKVSS